jgi:hypothetical protein
VDFVQAVVLWHNAADNGGHPVGIKVPPSDHASESGGLAPMSSNPMYDPTLWSSPLVIKSTNCYAYVANDPFGHPAGKPQPGEHSGYSFSDVDCLSIGNAAVGDGMIPGSNPPSPPPGYYPVALAIDPGVDYHWYRQDSHGLWSHKPGNTPVTDLDASGMPITNPEMADRNYTSTGGLNYFDFCGYFYVPAGGIRTGPP